VTGVPGVAAASVKLVFMVVPRNVPARDSE